MIVIADSGSTKTQWLLIDENKRQYTVNTEGINPYFIGADEIEAIIKGKFSEQFIEKVDKVFFYGAGCSTASKTKLVSDAISKVFTAAKVEVYSDLLASARALFGAKSGVACILGTGSNAAVYDGANFVEGIQSLGYILGDEGSGSYIGKQLLQAYLRNEMPLELRKIFASQFSIDISEVLTNVYTKSFPNRYLASFAAFAGEHKQATFIRTIIKNAFHDFIRYQLNTLNFDKKMKVGFVGSIAFYFQDILEQELKAESYNFAKAIKEPIHSLLDFHLS